MLTQTPHVYYKSFPLLECTGSGDLLNPETDPLFSRIAQSVEEFVHGQMERAQQRLAMGTAGPMDLTAAHVRTS